MPPTRIYRVARSGQVTQYSIIDPLDANLDKGSHRFDVLGGGVLYAATVRAGSYGETLARFRIPASIRQKVEEIDGQGDRMVCGGVPADWRAQRVMATLSLDDPLPFLDVEAPQTHEYLTSALADELAGLGRDVLNVSDVRGPNRRLTRAIASWAYRAVNDSDEPIYSGIRYVSKLGDWECWAIFDGTAVTVDQIEVIQTSDRDIEQVASLFGLRLF